MATEETGTKPEANLSRTPSWVMLGFLLGAAFVAMLPSWRPAPARPAEPAAPVAAPSLPAEAREPAPLTTIEAVFAVWQRLAVWSDDTTEVALWNARERAFSDCFEVRRWGDTLYFRSIPRLTRRVIERGQPPEAPLRFTETEEQYQQWLEASRSGRTATSVPPPPALPPAPAVREPPPVIPAAEPPRIEVSPRAPAVIR